MANPHLVHEYGWELFQIHVSDRYSQLYIGTYTSGNYTIKWESGLCFLSKLTWSAMIEYYSKALKLPGNDRRCVKRLNWQC